MPVPMNTPVKNTRNESVFSWICGRGLIRVVSECLLLFRAVNDLTWSYSGKNVILPEKKSLIRRVRDIPF